MSDPLFGNCDRCGAPRASESICSAEPLTHLANRAAAIESVARVYDLDPAALSRGQWVSAADAERARRDEMTPRIAAAGQRVALELDGQLEILGITGARFRYDLEPDPDFAGMRPDEPLLHDRSEITVELWPWHEWGIQGNAPTSIIIDDPVVSDWRTESLDIGVLRWQPRRRWSRPWWRAMRDRAITRALRPFRRRR